MLRPGGRLQPLHLRGRALALAAPRHRPGLRRAARGGAGADDDPRRRSAPRRASPPRRPGRGGARDALGDLRRHLRRGPLGARAHRPRGLWRRDHALFPDCRPGVAARLPRGPAMDPPPRQPACPRRRPHDAPHGDARDRGPPPPGDRRRRRPARLHDAGGGPRDRAADDPQDLLHNMQFFIVAGHETTALALSWSLFLLANDQEVQARARAEARAVLGIRAAGAEDVERMPYVESVIEEAMRLYPPVGLPRPQRARSPTGSTIATSCRTRRSSPTSTPCTATGCSGRTRRPSTPAISPPSARRSATATSTFPSAPARASASAPTSR